MELTRQQIESLPGYKKKTSKEYSSACPECGGTDRFCFWPDTGNYWCRQCGAKGFVTENNYAWTPEERERYLAEAAARAEQERQAKQTALEEMSAQVHIASQYHEAMTDRSYWYGQGLSDETINHYQLGYCPACPTYLASPSHTIPVYFKNKLLNIRHRLAQPPSPGDKYRPHRAGLPAVMFNADILLTAQAYVVLVEGEVKTMVLSQYLFPTVGVPGANIFPDRWVKWFGNQSRVYITFDPGAEAHARDIALMLGDKARIVSCPVKPDDFFVLYKGTPDDFCEYLKQGRVVR